MSAEIHIASLVLRCDPARKAGLLPMLRALPQTEIALEDADKIVLVMETEDESALAGALTRLQLTDGIASAALVYHHTLSDAEEGAAR